MHAVDTNVLIYRLDRRDPIKQPVENVAERREPSG